MLEVNSEVTHGATPRWYDVLATLPPPGAVLDQDVCLVRLLRAGRRYAAAYTHWHYLTRPPTAAEWDVLRAAVQALEAAAVTYCQAAPQEDV